MNFKSKKKIKFAHICFQNFTFLYVSIKGLHSSLRPIKKTKIFTSCPNLITSTLWQLDLLKFCWNDNIFLPCLHYKWLLHATSRVEQMLMIVSSNALDMNLVWRLQFQRNAPWGKKGLVDCTFRFKIGPELEDCFLIIRKSILLSEDHQDLVGKWCHISGTLLV